MGVTKEEFDDSAPVDLKCYILAEDMRRKRRDAEEWQQGMYNFSAFSTALSRVLHGRKAKAKYIEEPMSETIERKAKEAKEELTEEQKTEERSKLLMALMTMQANFELSKSREE